MITAHDQAMAAEVQYRQEQARLSWPKSRSGRRIWPPLIKKLKAALRRNCSSHAPQLKAAPRAGSHGLVLIACA